MIITQYKAKSKDLVIPATIQGLPVKCVQCINSSVKTLVFSEGIEVIGIGGNIHIDGITTVVLPSTVKVIGAEAFKGYKKLTSINLPEGLVAIDEKALGSKTKNFASDR